MQTKKIEIKRLQPNKGQIEGLPANPRKWTNADLEKLMESMEETPMLTEARGCIVYPFGDKFAFGIQMSANINTNPRTEQACITIDRGIYDFYKDYFDGINSFE